MKKQIILFVLLLSLMTAGVFPLQNTIGYASESSGRKIVTIVFDDSFSMANENRYSNANYAIQAFIALLNEEDELHLIYMSDAARQLAAQPLDAAARDEVAILRNSFIELARKITRQWDQLADSDRQRREFIANISHDLRTPLTSLLGYLETLSLKSATLTPQEHQQYLATALRQGQKVRHLSQQLFELARLEHGGIKPQRERFAMGELISDVAQKFELTARTREVNLHIDVPGPLPLVNADVSMIERVVTNLLDNAMRHTPTGGEIRLAVWQENEQLQVEVADSGTGVDASLRDDLFQRPSALNTQASRENRGGLGLLIVKRMLELHGGGIRLMESVSGARFRFFVPL